MPKRKRDPGEGHRDRECNARYLTDRETAKVYAGWPAPRYVLRLYTAGTHLRSMRVVSAVRRVCDTALPGKVELQIIDLYQQPELASRDGVVAAPCLMRLLPAPRQVYIGDMTDEKRLRRWLGIRASGHAGTEKQAE